MHETDLTRTARKVSKYGVFSGPYFPAFELNTERCGVSLRIQFECGEIRTKKTPYLDTFFALSSIVTMKHFHSNFILFSFKSKFAFFTFLTKLDLQFLRAKWGYSFNTYTKFPEKLTFLTPWSAHVRVRIRG